MRPKKTIHRSIGVSLELGKDLVGRFTCGIFSIRLRWKIWYFISVRYRIGHGRLGVILNGYLRIFVIFGENDRQLGVGASVLSVRGLSVADLFGCAMGKWATVVRNAGYYSRRHAGRQKRCIHAPNPTFSLPGRPSELPFPNAHEWFQLPWAGFETHIPRGPLPLWATSSVQLKRG